MYPIPWEDIEKYPNVHKVMTELIDNNFKQLVVKKDMNSDTLVIPKCLEYNNLDLLLLLFDSNTEYKEYKSIYNSALVQENLQKMEKKLSFKSKNRSKSRFSYLDLEE